MILKIKLFFILALFSSIASASVTFEPYFGENLILSKDLSIFSNYGARCFLSKKKISLGVDYGIGKFSDKTTSGTSKFTDSFTRKRIGIFTSYFLGKDSSDKVKKRIWFSYIVDVQDKIVSSGGLYQMGEVLKGKGLEIGFAKNLFSFISGYLLLRKFSLDQLIDTKGSVTTLSGSNIQNIYNFEFGIDIRDKVKCGV